MAKEYRTGYGAVEIEENGIKYRGSYSVFADGGITMTYTHPNGVTEQRSTFNHGPINGMAECLLSEMISSSSHQSKQ